jgi:predicted secreted Zn-dependent protease
MQTTFLLDRQSSMRLIAAIAFAFIMATTCGAAEPQGGRAVSDDDAIVIDERTSFYVLDAAGVVELRRQLDARGPLTRFGHPAAALTRHDIVIEYVLSRSGSACELTDAKVRAEIDMHIPKWQPKRTPAVELSEQWQRLETALREHEAGHRDNGIWATRELLHRLRQIPAAVDCKTLSRDAIRVRTTLVAELRAVEDAYDLRTDFSKTQLAPRIEDKSKRIEREDSERRRARRLLNGF